MGDGDEHDATLDDENDMVATILDLEEGDMLVDWFVCGSALPANADNTGARLYYWSIPNGMSMHAVEGLLAVCQRRISQVDLYSDDED